MQTKELHRYLSNRIAISKDDVVIDKAYATEILKHLQSDDTLAADIHGQLTPAEAAIYGALVKAAEKKSHPKNLTEWAEMYLACTNDGCGNTWCAQCEAAWTNIMWTN